MDAECRPTVVPVEWMKYDIIPGENVNRPVRVLFLLLKISISILSSFSTKEQMTIW